MHFIPPFQDLNAIDRVLITNRAEIASRIIRTCKLLGKTSIAIYTKQDEQAQFWKSADVTYYAGDLHNGNVYLDPERLIAIAKETNADAVHPGYGYLSENARFAKLVRDANLVWIGPAAETIDILGDKAACKDFLARNARTVPLIPGVHLTGNDGSVQAGKIGYPVLLKASAGGGGKGMRVVDSEDHLGSSLNMARSEAKRSFGSDDMLLEKYISAGKHVEVQAFGDAFGNVRTFADRECSVQRRHQKVIEEAPAVVSAELKEVMRKAAVEILQATKYVGAATIEFIVDVKDQKVYFLEVNTRIQVEHPITEEIFGIDLVALQLYVAANGSLSKFPTFKPSGHAIELRLYAEDPYTNFMPQTGKITLYQESSLPARYESSVATGSQVTIDFDPMICKIIVYAPDRITAINKTKRVLASTVCLGLQTNQEFLGKCLSQATFVDASYTTSLIGDNEQELLAKTQDEFAVIAVSALVRALSKPIHTRLSSKSVEIIASPTTEYVLERAYDRSDTIHSYTLLLRPVSQTPTNSEKALNPESHKLVARYYNSKKETGQTHDVKVTDFKSAKRDDYHILTARIQSRSRNEQVLATIHTLDDVSTLHLDRYGTYTRKSGLVGFGMLDSKSRAASGDTGNTYTSPMPCKIVRLEVSSGAKVTLGQGLLVVESMKTEVRVLARQNGRVTLHVAENDVVEEGALLASIDDEPSP